MFASLRLRGRFCGGLWAEPNLFDTSFSRMPAPGRFDTRRTAYLLALAFPRTSANLSVVHTTPTPCFAPSLRSSAPAATRPRAPAPPGAPPHSPPASPHTPRPNRASRVRPVSPPASRARPSVSPGQAPLRATSPPLPQRSMSARVFPARFRRLVRLRSTTLPGRRRAMRAQRRRRCCRSRSAAAGRGKRRGIDRHRARCAGRWLPLLRGSFGILHSCKGGAANRFRGGRGVR